MLCQRSIKPILIARAIPDGIPFAYYFRSESPSGVGDTRVGSGMATLSHHHHPLHFYTRFKAYPLAAANPHYAHSLNSFWCQ